MDEFLMKIFDQVSQLPTVTMRQWFITSKHDNCKMQQIITKVRNNTWNPFSVENNLFKYQTVEHTLPFSFSSSLSVFCSSSFLSDPFSSYPTLALVEAADMTLEMLCRRLAPTLCKTSGSAVPEIICAETKSAVPSSKWTAFSYCMKENKLITPTQKRTAY